ncbi:hypothetical protein [Streptomyces sp. NPDC001508]|uniref:hypothetical protein n=1 Tax=Streptomyces sp. NPDC001508 TaxID=3154656 RepID=UPI00331B1C51
MRRAGDILDRSAAGSVAEPMDDLWVTYGPTDADRDRMLNVNYSIVKCSIVNW